ncbi:hypothetical protein AKJ36_03410 [candidate division MSBL1 archaeon SCGC-AAA259I07]|uniref:Leucine-binding protein domain-containing protein n=1 Tax=candidate division MSBL1 archaeon SCGC-AAA259I07 TaxID=1698266 RepID=A0A133UJ19_9EURY|nr:hypothetical protein AKJ36_03410 [candidate division MSBL1 archaeon SCGC-AAA259I07]
MKTSRLIVIGVVVLVIAGVSAGIIFYAGGTAEEEKNYIELGFSFSKTGRLAPNGVPEWRSYQLWKEEVNEDGGIYVEKYDKKLPVRYTWHDDGSSTEEVVKNYKKLVNKDHVDLLLAPVSTTPHIAVSKILPQLEMPIVGNTAASMELREMESKWMFYTTSCIPDKQMKAFAEMLDSNPKIEKVAIITANNSFATQNRRQLLPRLNERQIEVVYDKIYPMDVDDLTPILSDIKNKNPDVLIALHQPQTGFIAFGQSLKVGITPKTTLMLNLIGPGLYAWENSFGPATNGVVLMSQATPEIPWPGLTEFWDAYEERWGQRPSPLNSVLGYASCEVLKQAIEKTGTLKPKEIKDTIGTSEFETIQGTIRYDENNFNVTTPANFAQWQGGKMVTVWPPELSSVEIQWPDPLK